jgi:hypothetical protein
MAHCQNFIPPSTSRRQMLANCANGFGSVALASLLGDPAYGATRNNAAPNARTGKERNPFEPRHPHFAGKARNVIFLYMDGGPSQVDTFDPKERLIRENGKPFGAKIEPTQFNNIGNVLASPWKFRRYGQSGIPVSDLFPRIAQHADDLCVIRSMTSVFSEHTNANYFLHTGFGLQGRPSMGAWVGYGLGSVCNDLPGFVVLNGGLIPPGGLDNFNTGFLPASYQGSVFKPAAVPVANIHRGEASAKLQQNKLDLMQRLDQSASRRLGRVDAVESAIANYELAYRMQTAVPDLMDMAGETDATKRLYGFDVPNKATQSYARQCLVARRLIERGVRFVELTCPNIGGADRWDQHRDLDRDHANNALAVDQPIAGLLSDLKSRGMLDDTLVIWAGEFGRTPFAQGTNGRDHSPFGFSLWMAGGGVKGGMTFGATDEYGYKAVENKLEMHDLHATLLHLLGVEHERLTYRWSGRDMRLTDVAGHVIKEILA